MSALGLEPRQIAAAAKNRSRHRQPFAWGRSGFALAPQRYIWVMWATLVFPLILMVTMLTMQWLESHIVGTTARSSLDQR